jgi:hypothetical protein
MNKAMLCTLKKGQEKKKILIIKEKIDTAAHNLEVDYQLPDTDPNVQQLITSQVGQKMELEFLADEAEWELSGKEMFISDFDYAYDLSSLKDFIDSLILFKADDREIDIEIIEMLKDDIFSAADFWENDTIDQDLTAELILKYWDLEPVQSYPDNDYYKKLMQFADGQIETIDQKTADFWFDIPPQIRAEINKLIEAGAVDFENYSVYLQTRDNYILNNILLNFIKEAAGEGQESIHNLFEKFHYQLIDELTKYSLEKDQKIDLNPIIPHNDSKREDFKLQPELEMNNYSLLEIFNYYSIEIDFNELNLFAENSIESLAAYLKSLGSHIEYLNQMRKKLKCDGCGQLLDYELDYVQETAAYRVKTARCNNLDCDKFDQEINLGG